MYREFQEGSTIPRIYIIMETFPYSAGLLHGSTLQGCFCRMCSFGLQNMITFRFSAVFTSLNIHSHFPSMFLPVGIFLEWYPVLLFSLYTLLYNSGTPVFKRLYFEIVSDSRNSYKQWRERLRPLHTSSLVLTSCMTRRQVANSRNECYSSSLTTLKNLFEFPQIFYYWLFLFQDPILEPLLHLVIRERT